MPKWVETICNSLRNTKIPQIFGDLIKFDNDDNLIGKCALGVIACDVGLPLSIENMSYSYDKIMEYSGVPEELERFKNKLLPVIDYLQGCGVYHVDSLDLEDSSKNSMLSTTIYSLNDAGLTFSEIADWLEITFGDWDKYAS